MAKQKRKIIYVEPITQDAKDRFETYMCNLHSCYVDSETDSHYYLTTINNNYKFQILKTKDLNWMVVK